jgi:predicted component of type VI protein secretion system
MKAELVPDNGDPPIPITRDVTVVGRRAYCDVVINDPSLSKRHCVLVKTDGLLVIRDLATTNGTKVKGQRIRWAALLPDDRITLGGYKLKVYLGPDHVPAPSELPRKGGASKRPMPAQAPAPAGKDDTIRPKGGLVAAPVSVPVSVPSALEESWVVEDDDADSSAWRDDLEVVDDEKQEDLIIELD